MAFLNEYKRRAYRKTTEYQVLMEDLVTLGLVKESDYNKLIGRKREPVKLEVTKDVCAFVGVAEHCDQQCKGCTGFVSVALGNKQEG